MHNEIGNGKVCEFTYINDFVTQQEKEMLQLFAFQGYVRTFKNSV